MTSALFVSHTAEKGGAELFMIDLMKNGPRAWMAAFLSDGPAAQELAQAGCAALVVEGDANVLAVRRGSRGVKTIVDAAIGVLRSAWRLAPHARKASVICANSQKALFVCAIACVLARRPLVWVLHDILTDPTFSKTTRGAALWVANTFARRIVVNSHATAQGFLASGGDMRRVQVIYNGFDPSERVLNRMQQALKLRSEFGFDGRFVVGMFGRLTPWKGQRVLLAALAKAPQVQALIVGGPLFGEEAYGDHLKQIATDLGLGDRVRFAGFRQDIPELMAGVDAVVHASTGAEPFGRVIVEGQLAGAPVIATAAGGAGEIIKDGATGLLTPPGDAKTLAEAILRLSSDARECERLGAAGRSDATSRFSLAVCVAAFSAMLEEVASHAELRAKRSETSPPSRP